MAGVHNSFCLWTTKGHGSNMKKLVELAISVWCYGAWKANASWTADRHLSKTYIETHSKIELLTGTGTSCTVHVK